jgi:type VI secretion system protein ImpE
MSASISALLRAGMLDAALAAANGAVRQAPADANARILLAELLLLAGNLERADLLLDAAAALDPSTALMISKFRQLLRAEMARRQFWHDGRMPEMLGIPKQSEQALLAANVAWRAGDAATAGRQTGIAETTRSTTPARIDGRAYADFRDADDLCGGNLEVLTTTGKFYWLPLSGVETIMFHSPRRPRDLAWRRADIAVTDGPDGTVYLPALYCGIEPPGSDGLRLGRETAWSDTLPVRGQGQRVFLAGEHGLGIMDLTEVHLGAGA